MVQQQSILIVDDSLTVRDMLAFDLKKAGYHVATASNGVQALDILKTEQFTFIITDVDMPEMDGFGLIRNISEVGFNPGVILMSGRDAQSLKMAQTLAIAYSVNLLATLEKPVDKSQLIQALNSVSDTKSNEFGNHKVLSETEFMRGLMTDGLVPVYQPKFNALTGDFHSVEVFARWRSGEGSLMGAQSIISLAEEKGYMDILTYRMLELAVEQMGEWKQAGYEVPISMNMIADNLRKPDFSDVVSGLVTQHGVEASNITMEVGEAELVMDEKEFLEVMARLHVRGFRLAIDDFGVGLGSFMHLEHIPFTELNIERSILERANESDTAYTILESVIDLARKLKIHSSCCGVSSEELLNLSKNLKIDYVQGFHLATPMVAEEFITWLDDHRSK